MMTQSLGVPRSAKRRSPISRSRSGSFSDSECDRPDWSVSGATTQTSSEARSRCFSSAASPAAWMPSSLVRRMRIGDAVTGSVTGLLDRASPPI